MHCGYMQWLVLSVWVVLHHEKIPCRTDPAFPLISRRKGNQKWRDWVRSLFRRPGPFVWSCAGLQWVQSPLYPQIPHPVCVPQSRKCSSAISTSPESRALAILICDPSRYSLIFPFLKLWTPPPTYICKRRGRECAWNNDFLAGTAFLQNHE